MSKEIKLIKNNDKRDWDDVEWIEEFFQFLQGTFPEGIKIRKANAPKLTPSQAWSIIWFLQEKFPVLPDYIEKCDFCNEIFNSHNSGHYSEVTRKHYCSSCDTYVDDGHELEDEE